MPKTIKSNLTETHIILLFILLFIAGLVIPVVSTFAILATLLFIRINRSHLFENFLLLLFLVSYYSFWWLNQELVLSQAVKNILIVQTSYMLVIYIRWNNLKYYPYNILMACLVYGIGFFVYGSLSASLTLNEYPRLITIDRTLVSFWTREQVNAISLASFFSVIVVLLPLFFYLFLQNIGSVFTISKRKKHTFAGVMTNKTQSIYHIIIFNILLLILISMSIISLYFSAITSTRTPFILLSISLVIFLLNFIKEGNVSGILFIIFGFGFFLVILYVLIEEFFVEEFFMIEELLINRVQEMGLESERFTQWIEGIENLFVNPWGGGKPATSSFFHNLWLDIGGVSGILPLVVIIIFQVFHIKDFYLIMKNKLLIPKIFISVIGSSIFLLYMSTPIMEASINYFSFTIFFFGMLKVLSSQSQNKNRTISNRIHYHFRTKSLKL
jgi:hypothetical protein